MSKAFRLNDSLTAQPLSQSGQLQQPTPKPAARKGVRVGRWLLFLALLGLGIYAVQKNARRPVEVQVATAAIVNIEGDFTAEGVVRGKEYRLSAEAAGRVTYLAVDEGQEVAKGELLLRLDDEDLRAGLQQAEAARSAADAQVSQAQSQLLLAADNVESRIRAARANVRNAEARLALAKKGARLEEVAQARHAVEKAEAIRADAQKALTRAEFLYQEGAIAKAMLEAAQTRLATATADVEAAKDVVRLLEAGPRPEEEEAAEATVSAARADLQTAMNGRQEMDVLQSSVSAAAARAAEARAAVNRASALLSKLDVRAPVAGTISRIDAELGATLTPGVPIITLATRNDIHIEAEISTEDIPKARKGLNVTVTSPGYPGRKFAGKIVQLSITGELKRDAAIRTRIVRARIHLTSGWRDFRPGMEVDVEGKALLKRALSVPSDAVVFDEKGAFVWVLADGNLEQRVVQLGFTSPNNTEIVDGLRAGEMVVVRGKEDLAPGKKVSVAK